MSKPEADGGQNQAELAELSELVVGRGYLYEPERRYEAYATIKQVAEYIKENEIQNLVLIDRAARIVNVGVNEYLRQTDSQQFSPQTYFINPYGCKNESVDVENQSGFIIVNSDLSEIHNVETFAATVAERPSFSQEHPQLAKRSGFPTLVFDTCTHTGKVLEPVVATLKREGFTNLHVGVAQDRDDMDAFIAGEREVEPDFVTEAGSRLAACYPFGPEFQLDRPGDSYLVRRATDSPPIFRTLSLMARQELRDVIRQFS